MQLAQYLDQKTQIESGYKTLNYSSLRFAFEQIVKDYVAKRIPSYNGEPLDRLHQVVPLELQQPEETNLNSLSIRVSEEIPELNRLYHLFIRHLAQNVFKEDLVFEERPQLRFHFPVKAPNRYRLKNGQLATQHSDVLLGDYFEQTNCWLPLTKCAGSSALQFITLDESIPLLKEFIDCHQLDLKGLYQSRKLFFEHLQLNPGYFERIVRVCKPYEIDYENLLMFDPRCLHGTAENHEDATRVSIDFRVLRVSDYEVALKRRKVAGVSDLDFEDEPLLKGGYYHSKTAFEVNHGCNL